MPWIVRLRAKSMKHAWFLGRIIPKAGFLLDVRKALRFKTRREAEDVAVLVDMYSSNPKAVVDVVQYGRDRKNAGHLRGQAEGRRDKA